MSSPLKSVIFFVYKNFSQFFWLFIYKFTRCLSMMAVILIYIHIQKPIFLRNVFIHKKQKKSILFTYGIPRALLRKEKFFCIFAKSQWFNSYKTVREFNKYLCNIKKKNGAQHNSMTILCYAFFKYENKLEIGWEK